MLARVGTARTCTCITCEGCSEVLEYDNNTPSEGCWYTWRPLSRVIRVVHLTASLTCDTCGGMADETETVVTAARLRACPLAALVRSFKADPSRPGALGPVWSAFDRVVAAVPEDTCDEALVKALEDLRSALSERLTQMSEALDAHDALLATTEAP